MKKPNRFYPRVHVDDAGVGVVSAAGGMLVTEAVRVSGLDNGDVGGVGAVAQADRSFAHFSTWGGAHPRERRRGSAETLSNLGNVDRSVGGVGSVGGQPGPREDRSHLAGFAPAAFA